MSRQATLINLKSEQAVLGGLLRSPDAFWQLADVLATDHFSSPLHREIFGAIRATCETSKKLSISALSTRLPEQTDDGQSVATYLAVLAANAEETGNPLDYAEDVAEAASRRRLLKISEQMAKAARDGEKAAIDVAAEAEAGILDIMQFAAPKRPRRLNAVVKEVIHEANTAWKQDVLPGCTSGLRTLDEILGLMLAGDLGFILAAQGDGKTVLGTTIGLHVAKSRPVLMVQADMTGDGIAARAIAGAANVSVREIQEGAFDAFQWDEVLKAEQALQLPDFYILDERKVTVRQIRSHALGLKRTVGLGMLIIDHLGKLKSTNRHRDRFERTAEITGDLKDLAKDLGVPVICLAQRTRTGQRRDDPEPHIDDADAPSIDHDGDWILGLWRRSTWLRRNKPNQKAGGDAFDKWQADIRKCVGVADVMLLKHRRRDTHDPRQLQWLGATSQVKDL